MSQLPEVTPDGTEKLFGLQVGSPALIDAEDLIDFYLQKAVVTSQYVTSSNVAAAIPALSTISLSVGYWIVEGAMVSQSTLGTCGMEYYFNLVSGTARFNANWQYLTTGTAGTHDGAGGTIMEGKAQRDSTPPGATTGVDSTNSDVMWIVNGIFVVTAAAVFDTMFRSEVNGTQVSTEVGSHLIFNKVQDF